MKRYTKEEIDGAKTSNGGWSREQLAAWGVPWPPKKGWRAKLEGRPKISPSAQRNRVKRKFAIQPSREFYATEEWQRVRYEVLRRSEGCCMLCKRQAYKGNPLHVDHIKPRSKYPELALTISNLQVLCRQCNMGKSNRYEDDWRPVDEPEALNWWLAHEREVRQ